MSSIDTKDEEKRMAGDALNEDTPESAAAADALSRSEKNKQFREGLLKDEGARDARIARSSAAEGYDMSGLDQDMVSQALQGKTWDENDQARYDKMMSRDPVNEPGGGIEPEVDGDPVDPSSPVAAPLPEFNTGSGDVNMPAIPTPGSPFGRGQNVVQDNDQVSNVDGDNNTVDQEQDNSVKNFGGEYKAMDWKNSWMNSKFSA